jgi:hypothetical protein
MSRSLALAGALALLILAPAARAADQPTWTPTDPIESWRYFGAGVRLADGDVLLVGGAKEGSQAVATVERYDHATGHWTLTAPLHHAREYPAAITLRDGRVLVTGGDSYIAHLSSTELYDPATGTWSDGPDMQAPRAGHQLALLNDGRVLAVGVQAQSASAAHGAEIYDPATNAWTATSATRVARTGTTVTKLADGRVLAAGGGNPWGYERSAEIYDPATDTWTDTAPMRERRSMAQSALLPDGRVLVAAGTGPDPQFFLPLPSKTTEIYDPTTDTWTAGGSLAHPRGMGTSMAVLTDGRPVMVDGHNGSGGRVEDTIEIYDADTDTWTEAPPDSHPRYGHIAVALTDNSILVAGGYAAGTDSRRIVFPFKPAITPPAPLVTPQPNSPPRAAKGVARLANVPSRLRATRTGVIRVRVSCIGASACRERLVLRLRTGRTLARTTVVLATGKARTVRLKLAKRDRRKLAKHPAKATLTLGTLKRSLTLRG